MADKMHRICSNNMVLVKLSTVGTPLLGRGMFAVSYAGSTCQPRHTRLAA